MSQQSSSSGITVKHEQLRIAGRKVDRDGRIEVRFPYTGELVATVPKATLDDVRSAFRIAREYRSPLTRYDRYKILMRAGEIIAGRIPEVARIITLESGLCLKDSTYEVGRASDVLLFAANQALVDDGQIFSCDLTAHGKQRKVYTLREPLAGVIVGITPFNHPLNQVIHKVAPAIATPKPEAHEAAVAFETTMAFIGVPVTVAAEMAFWAATSCCCRVSTETPAFGCNWKMVFVPSREAPVT